MRASLNAPSKDLLWNLTLRELRGRYKRSWLGWAWSLVNPLAMTAIFTVVFSVLLVIQPPVGDPSGLESFPIFLLSGLLAWNFFANSVSGSMGSLLGYAGLLKKVYFPRETVVYASVLSLVFTFLMELGLLSVVLLVLGNFRVLLWIPVLAVLVVLLAAFAAGLAMAMSAANVYFRDLQYLWGIATMIWFYATPIVYPISLAEDQLSGWLWKLYLLNPMTQFVESFRDVMYDFRAPPATSVAYLVVVSAVSFVAGLAAFKRLSRRFAEEL